MEKPALLYTCVSVSRSRRVGSRGLAELGLASHERSGWAEARCATVNWLLLWAVVPGARFALTPDFFYMSSCTILEEFRL